MDVGTRTGSVDLCELFMGFLYLQTQFDVVKPGKLLPEGIANYAVSQPRSLLALG